MAKKSTPAEKFVAKKRKTLRDNMKRQMLQRSPFASGYGFDPISHDSKEAKQFETAAREMKAAGRRISLSNPDKSADDIATWIEESDRRRAEEPPGKKPQTPFRLRKLKDAAKARARRRK